MLDFNHVVNAPGFNVQTFYGTTVGTTLREWETWIKPRGSRMLWIFAVGGGGSGGNSRNSANTSGGGGGGGSGAQSSVIIPSAFVPDTLYVQAGRGGIVTTAASGAAGQAGLPTYVSLEPDTTLTPTNTLLFANAGAGGGGGTAAAGVGGAGGAVATLPNMPLAGRGIYQFFAGQNGANGGAATGTVGESITLPTTGLMVCGGAGGGGKSSTVFAQGGSILGVGSGEFYSNVIGGLAASGATPGQAGGAGVITRNYLMNYGGAGGGSASQTSGGQAGRGGDAAPGSGGGGAGASTNQTGANTLPLPGRGGDGFVIFLSW